MTRPGCEEVAEINEVAGRYYRDQLHASPHAGPRDYLAARGFGELLGETSWSIGYAPAGWTGLHSHLAERGYSDQTMLTAGLIAISRRGTPIDRFRDRITFGIRDLDSQLVGFTARAAPTAQDRTPKYLNTPSTPAYDKSAVLFGLGEAKANHAAEAFVVTEGPLDALAVALAGEGRWAPLALCGTSLSTEHARRLAWLAPSALLALDDDSAGHRALERAIATLTPIHGEPKAAHVGLGQDPAGLFSRLGPDALRTALESATPASNLVITRLLQKWGVSETAPHQTYPCLREAATTLVHELAAAVTARRPGWLSTGTLTPLRAEVPLSRTGSGLSRLRRES